MFQQSRRLSDFGIYHVMIRGISHKNIFAESEDYCQFPTTLNKQYNHSNLPARLYTALCLLSDVKLFPDAYSWQRIQLYS